MAATPAWPPASTPRLFVAAPLAEGTTLDLDGGQAHYLANVLRLGAGAPLRLFDDATGEWLAEIAAVARKSVAVIVRGQLRPREAVPDLWLLFAPIKKAPIDWLVEKATELGIARLQPVITRRTIVDRVNLDRLRTIAVEAAEQCDRTALPELAAPATLATLLRDWPEDRALLFADEQGGAPLAEAARPGAAAILVGPEGGFTDEERALLGAHAATRRISLGPRILRAETAALAAVTLWMGAAGDWRSSR